MRRKAASVLLLCAIVGVASCGGNGDNDDTTAPTARTVTKQEYIREGDAICGEVDQKLDAIPTPPPNAPPAEALRFSEQLLTATKPRFDRFKALPAPPSDKAIVDQLNSNLDQCRAPLGASALEAVGQGFAEDSFVGVVTLDQSDGSVGAADPAQGAGGQVHRLPDRT